METQSLFLRYGPFSGGSLPCFQKGRAAARSFRPSSPNYDVPCNSLRKCDSARAGRSDPAEKKGTPPVARRSTDRSRRPSGHTFFFLLTFTSGQALIYSHFLQASLASQRISATDLQESRAFGFPGSLADRQERAGFRNLSNGDHPFAPPQFSANGRLLSSATAIISVPRTSRHIDLSGNLFVP